VKVVISTDARRDRREADSYYQRESPRSRVTFRRDLENALQFIATYPLGAPFHAGDTRAKVLLHFPCSILYRVVGNRVFVVAIADQRRDPDYYADRIS
jgi:plasmid stabilization system protein ParE